MPLSTPPWQALAMRSVRCRARKTLRPAQRAPRFLAILLCYLLLTVVAPPRSDAQTEGAKSGTQDKPQAGAQKPSDAKEGAAPGQKPAGEKAADKPADAEAAKKKKEAEEAAKKQAEEDERFRLNLPADYLKQGAPKTPHPRWTLEKLLQGPTLTNADLARVAQLQKAAALSNDEKGLVDRWVQAQVYGLSDPAKRAKPKSLAAEKDRIRTALKNASNPAFKAAMLEGIIKYAPDLFDNQIQVALNAVLLLAEIDDERSIAALDKVLRDAKQLEGIQLAAVQGIGNLARAPGGITNVALSHQAAEGMLSLLRRNDPIKHVTRHEVIRTVGQLKRFQSNPARGDGDVAIALLVGLRDKQYPLLQRSTCAWAIAQLDIPAELDCNFQLLSSEIGGFLLEVGRQAQSSPQSDRLLYYYAVNAQRSLDLLHEVCARRPAALTKNDNVYSDRVRRAGLEVALALYNAYKKAPAEKPATTGGTAKPDKPAAGDKPPATGATPPAVVLPANFADLLAELEKAIASPRVEKLTPSAAALPPLPVAAKPADPTAGAKSGSAPQ